MAAASDGEGAASDGEEAASDGEGAEEQKEQWDREHPARWQSVGHLAGTWSAHRVVWVWVVRGRWSACSAGVIICI
jgi:hypothetical protein